MKKSPNVCVDSGTDASVQEDLWTTNIVLRELLPRTARSSYTDVKQNFLWEDRDVTVVGIPFQNCRVCAFLRALL